MRIKGLALCMLSGLLPLPLPAAETGEWIDLTHELSGDAVFWPTAAPFSMSTDFEGVTDKGYFYSAYSFTTAEHGGTHIDAPVHFAQGANHVDEIPLQQLIGDAVVIDVSAAVQADRDQRLRQSAAVEDVDLRTPRGLDRSLFVSLCSCQWVSQHLNVLITGKTGTGKSFLACALAQKACREGFTVAYHRVPRLLSDLGTAKVDGRYFDVVFVEKFL